MARSKISVLNIMMILTVFLTVIAIFPEDVFSVNFSINPVRIVFDSGKKSEVITLKNTSTDKVALQISAVTWTQDEKEENVYAPTDDILFFPKLLELAPDEERIVRIGIKVAHEDAEKTYRLFFEEIPVNSEVQTSSVKIIVRVGIPIFITPHNSHDSGIISEFGMSNSILSVAIRNEGNAHFIIKSMQVTGQDAFGEELYTSDRAGGYLHHGKSKTFTFEIPQDKCRAIKAVSLNVETDSFDMGKKLEIVREMCGT